MKSRWKKLIDTTNGKRRIKQQQWRKKGDDDIWCMSFKHAIPTFQPGVSRCPMKNAIEMYGLVNGVCFSLFPCSIFLFVLTHKQYEMSFSVVIIDRWTNISSILELSSFFLFTSSWVRFMNVSLGMMCGLWRVRVHPSHFQRLLFSFHSFTSSRACERRWVLFVKRIL